MVIGVGGKIVKIEMLRLPLWVRNEIFDIEYERVSSETLVKTNLEPFLMIEVWSIKKE